jgi:hypothetical protein
MVARTDTAPTLADLGDWVHGSRTVVQAVADSGLSRDKLFDLMREGRVRWKVEGGRSTRLVCWFDVVSYVWSLPDGTR